jgi:hypothetical protein
MTMAAAGGAVAVFAAGGPGENLSPTRDSDLLVDLTQVGETVLWTSLTGNVSTVKTLGWPSSQGENDLGGALFIEVPTNATAGTVNIGEKPMSIELDISG